MPKRNATLRSGRRCNYTATFCKTNSETSMISMRAQKSRAVTSPLERPLRMRHVRPLARRSSPRRDLDEFGELLRGQRLIEEFELHGIALDGVHVLHLVGLQRRFRMKFLDRFAD